MDPVSDSLNLRHLRAFLEVCRAGSISAAADRIHLSQPAITHGLANLENRLRAKLFVREARGMAPTGTGAMFRFRVERALSELNARLPRPEGKGAARLTAIETRATAAQLRTLIAVADHASYSAAARALGTAQPTVHRAARDLEAGLGLTLLTRGGHGVHPTRAGARLAQNARLMFAELDQGLQEVRTAIGQGSARIRIGALPLARATILSRAIDALAEGGVRVQAYVDDGPYPDLLHALRMGNLDILIGALRAPPPARDVIEEVLFSDRLGVFCGPNHPLRGIRRLSRKDLSGFPWVVPRPGTPTRRYFDGALGGPGPGGPEPLIETSSMVLIRELLQSRDRLTLISKAQVATEVRSGVLFELPVDLDDPPRAIGLTRRSNWYPTPEQDAFLASLRLSSAAFGEVP